MLAALGASTTAAANPITVRADDHTADAAAGPGGGLPSDPAVTTPRGDDDPAMDDDTAAPQSASARSGPSSPVDDDAGPAPGQEGGGAAPVGDVLCYWDEDRGRDGGHDDIGIFF